MQTIDVDDLLAATGWQAQEPEPGIWRCVFATERDEDFDLYIMLSAEWLHLAVSPLVRPAPGADMARLAIVLARLNQQMRLARLAMDEAGDVNLVADLPRAGISTETFGVTLDLLTRYTEALAVELRRIAHEPGYHSAALGMP